jgi:RecJ-like exonuclease
MTQDTDSAINLLVRIRFEQATKNLERKLSSLVTDVCNDCLGSGSLQFCGGETCPECNGTGKPPSEVKVYRCKHCLITRLEQDLRTPAICSPARNHGFTHEWFLESVYTEDNNAPY